MIRRCLIAATFFVSSAASAGLVVTFSDDGSGGVLASFSGSGTIQEESMFANFLNVGDYTTSDLTVIPLTTPISVGGTTSIIEITIDDDSGQLDTSDDFSVFLDNDLPVGTAYSLNGEAIVPNISFSSFNPGSFGADATFGPFDSVTIVVQASDDPVVLLEEIVSLTVSLNINAGISNALDSKLQNVIDALDRARNGDAASAAGMLYAFIQSVEAQRGKALTDQEANELIAGAEAVINAIDQG